MTNSGSFTYPEDAQCELHSSPNKCPVCNTVHSILFVSTAAVIVNFNSSISTDIVGTTGSCDGGFESHLGHGCLECTCVYSVCAVLCLGIGLATSLSLIQGVLPIVE
jgi:hypothetical protein